jgi:hypothetical protein
LRYLRDFFDQIPFPSMQPAADVLVEKPAGMEARVLAEAGKLYAIYLHHGREAKGAKPQYQVDRAVAARKVALRLPAGSYTAVWRDPKTGRELKSESKTTQAGMPVLLESPPYAEDVVLNVSARPGR